MAKSSVKKGKKTASQAKSKQKTSKLKPKRKTESVSLPKKKQALKKPKTPSSKKSEKSFKAVFLNTKNKPLKRFPTGKKTLVKLGIQYGDKVQAFEMEPQRPTKSDLRNLQVTLEKKEKLLAPKSIADLGSFLFFQARTTKNQREGKKVLYQTRKDKNGNEKVILDENGKPIPKKVLKISVKPPKARKGKAPVWRELEYSGTKFLRLSSAPLQARDRFEALTSELLRQADKAPLPEYKSGIQAAFQQNSFVLEGSTIKNALRKLRIPVSTAWLIKNDIQAVNCMIELKITHKGEKFNLGPFFLTIAYMTDFYEEISTRIRRELARNGLTFTRMRTFQEIKVQLMETRTRQQFTKEWKAITQIKTGPNEFTSLLGQIAGQKEVLEELAPGAVIVKATFSYMKRGSVPKLPKHVKFIQDSTIMDEME